MTENDPVLEFVGDMIADIETQMEESRTVVNRAVVVAECMDEDGDRWLRVVRSRDTKHWEARGMLSEVLVDLSNFDLVDMLRGDE